MPVRFDRRELDEILRLYGRMVAANEWRDYAICSSPDSASFAVFKSAREYPQFVISKLGKGDGRGKAKAGRYVVTSRECRLCQGHSLDDVLAVFNKPLGLIGG